ncbi:hypothetical protein HK097_011629 [Rhizophlyctis rosea]|uniref:Uncharacterized protein n=1 Tax=Rhizophlyctis rosea TaxID=64517 RepID=A0AAD5SHK0_9FUNG|nr:hypothetical protein HK097_011629 [Rhizophlyctis rosea]
MGMKTLHRVVNSLEYLNKAGKLKQMEIVRLWGSKSEKFDTFLMQTLVPYLNMPDEEIQMATIRVLHALIPSFNTASPADIAFAWSYFRTLMDSKIRSPLLQAVLLLIKEFPLPRLNEDAREEILTVLFNRKLLKALFRLCFHRDPAVRSIVYDLIGSSTDFWKSSGLFASAMGILLLCIGDHNVECAKKVITHLFQLSTTPFRTIVTPLGLIKDALTSPQMVIMKAYDELANVLARERIELKELIDAMVKDENVDEFWDFWLRDVPENQLVRPDEYSYTRNFVQSPFWCALVLTRLGVAPPVVASNEATPRDVMPTTPAGKRRFLCGFMLCLLPTCGMPDPGMRRAACICAIRCCFSGFQLNPGIMRGLLEYASQQMLQHKQWTFQVLIRYVARLKLPGIAPAILIQYLDLALEVAYNSPSSTIKISALELIETLLLVFPHGIGTKLSEVRDTIRYLITDVDADVVNTASRIYPLIFRCVSSTNAVTFYEYLRDEVNVIEKGGLEAAGDPHVANLDRDQAERVMRLSLVSIGTITGSGTAFTIVQELMRHLRNSNPSFRAAALSSILAQIPQLDGVQSQMVIWTILPMYADPSRAVRLAFSRYLRKIPSRLESLCKCLPPHPDDSLIMPNTSWEDLLTDQASYTVNTKNLDDIMSDLDALMTGPDPNVLPLEDDGFHVPTISEKLMARIKDLVRGYTGVVPLGNVSQVLYHLQAFQSHPQMQGSAMLVLSEFCCLHEGCQGEIIDIFVNCLGHEILPETTTLIEACTLGLKNIADYAPATFKQILAKITAPAIANEGDLIALLYLSDAIRDVTANKAPELLRKYLPVLASQRNSVKKRLLAMYLSVELALIAGQDEMVRVLDTIQGFLDSVDEEDVKIKIYNFLGKELASLGPKHTLFRGLLSNAKKEVKSKDPAVRMRTLAVFRIFTKHLAAEEAMWFCFLYLADSNRDIRRKAKELIISEGLIDFAVPGLRVQKPSANPLRSSILDACKLPSIQSLGVTINTNAKEESAVTVPLRDEDPYNARWYSSDTRKKLTDRYGLPEALFDRATIPVSRSIMTVIDEKCTASKKLSPEQVAKSQWLLNLDTVTILHECMKKYPNVAVELIENTLDKVEEGMRDESQASTQPKRGQPPTSSDERLTGSGNSLDEDEGVDIEAEIHLIDLLSNLLFAYGGRDDKIYGWMDRLQAFITACNNGARIIREGLYTDLENSFFFYSDYIDVPIVSDEQYEALEAFKAAAQDATLEIVKTGKTDKLTSLEAKKNDLNDVVDAKSEQLRRLTIMALHGTSGYGLYHALSTTCPETRLIDAFQFISGMLENEHRGIRIAAVEALVTITKLQLS